MGGLNDRTQSPSCRARTDPYTYVLATSGISKCWKPPLILWQLYATCRRLHNETLSAFKKSLLATCSAHTASPCGRARSRERGPDAAHVTTTTRTRATAATLPRRSVIHARVRTRMQNADGDSDPHMVACVVSMPNLCTSPRWLSSRPRTRPLTVPRPTACRRIRSVYEPIADRCVPHMAPHGLSHRPMSPMSKFPPHDYHLTRRVALGR